MYKKVLNSITIFRKRGPGTLVNSLLTKGSLFFKPNYCLNQPNFAQIEVTTYCNLKCSTCREFEDQFGEGGMISKHMTLEKFREILSKLPYLTNLRLNGIGEPLLNPQLFKMINYASSKGIRTNFVTNGTMLKKDATAELINSGLNLLIFSIDGAGKETFERVRAGAKFDEVCQNIRNIVGIKKERDCVKPHLAVMTTVSKENIRELPEIVSLVNSLGIKNIILKGMIPSVKELEAKIVSDDEIYRFISRAQETANNLQMNLHSSPFKRISEKKTSPENPGCMWPWTSTYINVDGWVTPCCNLFDSSMINFGNIFEKDFKIIWNNKDIQKFRSRLKIDEARICYKMCDLYLYR